MIRRDFLKHSMAAGAASLAPAGLAAAAAGAVKGGGMHVATFRFDVTPPKGHSLCGGWIKPVADYDDPLEAIGYVLLGAGQPIVFCVVDWTGILNDAHVKWRTVLAEAAGTTPERVALHCVHQHNAPMVCFDAERMIARQGDLPHVFEIDFHRQCLDRARDAVLAGLRKARPITHVAFGMAPVAKVASNRRVARNAQGRVTAMRGSGCKDPALIALPEGLIDPTLRTIAWYDRGTKVLATHFYATHPMSYYGDGRVSSDFCGLARRRRQADEPGCTHLYFTGCAGNITAGKYNQGSPGDRVELTRRIYEGMVASEANLRPEPIDRIEWRTRDLHPTPNPALGLGALEELMQKKRDAVVLRMRPAFKLAWIARCERRVPLVLGALHVNDISALYLPSEPFIEYQLRAQQMTRRSLAVAAYGDNGPWYLPTKPEYPAGGYEVDFAFCNDATDDLLTNAMQALLA